MSNAEAQSDHDDLLLLFADWRTFESPPLLEGAPDYTPAIYAHASDNYAALRERLRRSILRTGRFRNRSTGISCAPR